MDMVLNELCALTNAPAQKKVVFLRSQNRNPWAAQSRTGSLSGRSQHWKETLLRGRQCPRLRHQSHRSPARIHLGPFWNCPALSATHVRLRRCLWTNWSFDYFFLKNWLLVTWPAPGATVSPRRSKELVEETDITEIQKAAPRRRRSGHSNFRAKNLHWAVTTFTYTRRAGRAALGRGCSGVGLLSGPAREAQCCPTSRTQGLRLLSRRCRWGCTTASHWVLPLRTVCGSKEELCIFKKNSNLTRKLCLRSKAD